MHFQKKSQAFPKTYLFYQRKLKFEFFENFKAKIPRETLPIKFLPKVVILKKFRLFFENTHWFSRNSHFFERFEFPWAIILFETRARRKMPNLPILKENLDLLKKQHPIHQKVQKFDCFELSQAIWKPHRLFR